MITLITKASDSYWYDFKDINTIEDLMKIYPRVIVQENYFIKRDTELWGGWFKQADILKLEKAKYHVTIYDDYVE